MTSPLAITQAAVLKDLMSVTISFESDLTILTCPIPQATKGWDPGIDRSLSKDRPHNGLV
jgi:hypothetical protein